MADVKLRSEDEDIFDEGSEFEEESSSVFSNSELETEEDNEEIEIPKKKNVVREEIKPVEIEKLVSSSPQIRATTEEKKINKPIVGATKKKKAPAPPPPPTGLDLIKASSISAPEEDVKNILDLIESKEEIPVLKDGKFSMNISRIEWVNKLLSPLLLKGFNSVARKLLLGSIFWVIVLVGLNFGIEWWINYSKDKLDVLIKENNISITSFETISSKVAEANLFLESARGVISVGLQYATITSVPMKNRMALSHFVYYPSVTMLGDRLRATINTNFENFKRAKAGNANSIIVSVWEISLLALSIPDARDSSLVAVNLKLQQLFDEAFRKLKKDQGKEYKALFIPVEPRTKGELVRIGTSLNGYLVVLRDK